MIKQACQTDWVSLCPKLNLYKVVRKNCLPQLWLDSGTFQRKELQLEPVVLLSEYFFFFFFSMQDTAARDFSYKELTMNCYVGDDVSLSGRL